MSTRRSRGILKVKRHNAPGMLARAKLMEKGLEDHPSLFSAPNPALPIFSNQIAVTDEAQVLATQGGKGMAAARDVQLGLLAGMMMSELVYMQSVADSGSPDAAIATLHAGGVEIADFALHDKAILTVTQGPAPGAVVLAANVGILLEGKRHRTHFVQWAYTTDGRTFFALPPTPDAKTTLSGLTPLTRVGFRVAVTTAKGVTSAWSQVFDFLVH
jgi:hypothetical protein